MNDESPKSHAAGARDETPSLDPADWKAFRALCHEMLDDALGHVEGAGEGPVWRPVPDEVKTALAEPLPLEPQGTDKVCDDVRRLVLPYATGNTHPRFFGWVHGSGTAGGMLAELMTGALNANLGGRDHAPIYVERQVIAWCRELFGFPEGASGLLVSGTSMATLIGLTVARNQAAGHDVRAQGLGAGAKRLVAYTSSEAHGSVAKAFEILGLGRDSLQRVPADDQRRMDCESLARMIAEDRATGFKPFCVIGTAGTVNTGAIDDLAGIAEICAREDLWFHVDGAFGAAAMLSEATRPRLAGIERADSLAFDFHKWFHVPYDAGCLLVRDEARHRETFSARQEYLAAAERGLAGGNPWFCEYGPELSRGFRALKVWFTLKEHGTRRLGEKVEDNCRQAAYLADCVGRHAKLELLAPVSLNIVCFRYTDPALAPEAHDRVNGEIVTRLQEQGIAAPSTTRLDGRLAIRVNITNHRSRMADFDTLVEAVAELGATLAAEGGSAELPAPPPSSSPSPDFQLARIAEIDPAMADNQHAAVEAACLRPELRLLSSEVAIVLDPALAEPFTVTRGEQVALGPDAFANPTALALHLRHAFELALLQRLTPGEWTGARALVLALLACRATGIYLRSMIDDERTACQEALPDRLRAAIELAAAGPLNEITVETLDPLAGPLLRLQGQNVHEIGATYLDHAAWRRFGALLRTAEPLAAPAEFLLTTGGDIRLGLDPASGLNAYGCSPRPRPWAVTFASSTATSISDLAYQEVERLRQDLMSAALLGDLHAAYCGEVDCVERALRRFCGAEGLAGTEVVLSTSGTDAELYALHFALPRPGQELVNIVIAPDETGSGVVKAAGGRHFAAVTATGAAVEPGAPLAGFAEGRVVVETVPARDESGALRPLAEIDGAVERLVEQAVAKGARCLVHLLDASKTGWGAPGLDLLQKLGARHPEALDVVVDACQMRAGPAVLRGYLEQGFMVQVTGSKFFTGPPFSGALILPAAVAARADSLAPLPASFADYTARAEWPVAWTALARHLPERRNLGLLFRWTAALWEIRAFHAVPVEEQRRTLTTFGQVVLDAMAGNEAVTLAAAPTYDRGALSPAGAWDRLTTIFAFTMSRPGTGGERITLSYDEARKVYHWLNRDIAAALPKNVSAWKREVARKRCHIGQPVKLARQGEIWIGALRLCAGARIVSGTAFDPALGATPAERLKQECDDAVLVLDKVALIARYWDDLEKAGTLAPGAGPAHQV